MDWKPECRYPDMAYENAITKGSLTETPDPNYAGDYMYMFSERDTDGRLVDAFKHIMTRRYLRIKTGA